MTNPDPLASIRALIGQRVPGGCDHCDAYQEVEEDPSIPNITHITIRHDDWCPVLARVTMRGRVN